MVNKIINNNLSINNKDHFTIQLNFKNQQIQESNQFITKTQ